MPRYSSNHFRFRGWSKTRIAVTCSSECGVGFQTCFDVLFHGKANQSHATRHVVQWARRERFPIIRPDAGRGEVDAAKRALDDAERRAGLDAAGGESSS
jgi:hypothetical protein